MSLILAIETSTKVCSVALFNDTECIAFKEEGGTYSHAEKLNVFIQEVMQEGGIKLNNIDAVAVGKGPGSYTGLRIGVSSAKGICYSLNKPLLAINSLYTMAAGAKSQYISSDKKEDTVLFCPMIDARRMEVYAAIYDTDLNIIRDTAADIIDEQTHYQAFLNNATLLYFGDGAEKCQSVFDSNKNMVFFDPAELMPSAKYMGALAERKFASGQFEDVAYFEPFYLKDFMATTPKRML